MLTSEQRAELDALGTAGVRIKLFLVRRRAEFVHGFKSGELKRSDVEAWLLEKYSQRNTPSRRTKILALTILVAAILGIVIAQVFFEFE
jgi:hypothetical protein